MEDDEKAGLTDEDAVPEVPVEPITQPGDIYFLDNHRLLCGDSTVLSNVEKVLDGALADMGVHRSALQCKLCQHGQG